MLQEKKNGNVIVSLDEKTGKQKQIEIPVVERFAGTPSMKTEIR